MKKITIFLSIFLLGAGFASAAFDNLKYPIEELGSCGSKAECATYCNKTENMSACISYAEQKQLMSKEEIKTSKLVAEKMKIGKMPGSCSSKETCETYCQGDLNHLEECLSFADEIGMNNASIEEGKRVAKALKEGAALPGGCTTKETCETYCADSNNIEECLNFGEKSGIIGAEELAEAKKVMQFIKSGETPGGCKRKADCDSYCQQEGNFQECLAFAEKAGFVSKEEAEMAKKSGGKGPGGCKSQAECEAYCVDDAHLDECVEFGLRTGAISKEDVELMKGGVETLRAGLDKIPAEAKPDAEACLNNVFGGKLQEVLGGTVKITKTQGDKIGPCIEEAVSKYAQQQMEKMQQGLQAPQGEAVPPAQIPSTTNIQTAPSGQQGPPCSSPEECMRMFGPQR